MRDRPRGPGLGQALDEIPVIRERVLVGSEGRRRCRSLNQSLEYAGRVADFLELAELMCRDALERDESCGCHLREEHQTDDGEAIRDDERFAHVAVWEYQGADAAPIRHEEPVHTEELEFTSSGAHAQGVTGELHAARVAPGAADAEGRFETYEVVGRRARRVVPRDARCAQRPPDRRGRAPDRVRPRLPRGDLRFLLDDDRRVAARSPPGEGCTTCQLYMREFDDGATIRVEPFRATAFPVIRDLIVDRSAFDRIIQAGGYTGVNAGPKPEPNANPVSPEDAEEAIDAAICIGCGACVAACPNGAAMLFTGAKVTHLSRLPQGQPGRFARVQDMVEQMDAEGFGGCTNNGECQAVCPIQRRSRSGRIGPRSTATSLPGDASPPAFGRRRDPAETAVGGAGPKGGRSTRPSLESPPCLPTTC